MPKISLVILTRNHKAAFLDCVSRALALPERPPLIAVDNGSTDGTAAALKARHPTVKLVRIPFDMGEAARELGAHRVDTPYFAFCEDDGAWAPGSLAQAVSLLDMYPRVDMVRFPGDAQVWRRRAYLVDQEPRVLRVGPDRSCRCPASGALRSTAMRPASRGGRRHRAAGARSRSAT